MKNIYIFIAIAVATAIAWLSTRKKKDTTDGTIELDSPLVNGKVDNTPIAPPSNTPVAQSSSKLFNLDDAVAVNAIEKKMEMLHSNWRKSSDGGVDILKNCTPVFQQIMSATLSKQGMSRTSTRIGYTEEFQRQVQAYSGNPLSGSIKDLGRDYCWNNVVLPFLASSDKTALGGANYGLSPDEATNAWKNNRDYCCKDVTKLEWLMDDFGKMFGNILNVSIKYSEFLREKAIQDLRNSGWKFVGYDYV